MKTLLLCFFPIVLFSQGEKIDSTTINQKISHNIRYGFSVNQSLTRYGLPSSILFTLHYKKHQFDIGPLFQLGRSINEDQKKIGVGFNYHFYPTADTTRFTSFALLNFDYFYEFSTRKGGIHFTDDPTLNGQLINSEFRTHNLALNIGYGIKFRLVGGFYLGSHAGVGIHSPFYVKKTKMIHVDWNSVKKRSENNLGFVATFFIGYKF